MKEQISSKQFFSLVVVYIIANDLVRGMYALELENDTWIPNLIGSLISMFLFSLYMLIYKNTKFNSFDNSVKHIFGKIISKVVFVLYIVYFIVIAFFNVIDITETVLIHLLPNYSYLLIIVIFLLTSFYLLINKLETASRISVILFIAIVFNFTAMCLITFTLYEFDYDNVLPILYNGYEVILRPSFEMGYAIPFGELFAIFIIYQHVDKIEKHTKVVYFSIITAAFILIIITLFDIFIMGPYSMSYGLSPALRLARSIDIEEYIQRLDLLLLCFHTIVMFIKVFVLLYAAGYLFKSTVKIQQKQTNIFYGVMLFLIFLLSIFFGKNSTDLLVFRKEFFIKYISLVFEVFLPLIMVILSFIRKDKKIIKPDDLLDYSI